MLWMHEIEGPPTRSIEIRMQCLEHVTASRRALHVRAESEPRHFAAPSLLATTSSATIRYRALTLISVHGENISGSKKKAR